MKYRFCKECLHKKYCSQCNDPPSGLKYCPRSFDDLEAEYMAYWTKYNPNTGEKYEPHPRKK